MSAELKEARQNLTCKFDLAKVSIYLFIFTKKHFYGLTSIHVSFCFC